jgi:hypothetical protein
MKLCHIATERPGGYVKRAMSGKQWFAIEIEEVAAPIAPDNVQQSTPALLTLTPCWQKNGIRIRTTD